MTKNPHQMQINFDDVHIETTPTAENTISNDELDELLFSPSFQNLDSDIQDRVLDECAEQLGSYHEASLFTGIKIGLDCATVAKPVEVVKTPASVTLRDRANYLHKSLREYSRESSNFGLIDHITDPSRVRPNEIDFDRVERLEKSAKKHNRLGKKALVAALGSMDDLISEGFDKAEVKQKLTEEASNFEDYYYNPDNNTKQEPYKNDNRRKDLRKATRKYLDLPN